MNIEQECRDMLDEYHRRYLYRDTINPPLKESDLIKLNTLLKNVILYIKDIKQKNSELSSELLIKMEKDEKIKSFNIKQNAKKK